MSDKEFDPNKHVFSSGAYSSGKRPRYDLIPTFALVRIAKRFEEGAAKYGEDNWKQGLRDKAFVIDRLNHAIDHLLIMRDRINAHAGAKFPISESGDDDAAAVAWGAILLMAYEETFKDDLARSGVLMGDVIYHDKGAQILKGNPK